MNGILEVVVGPVHNGGSVSSVSQSWALAEAYDDLCASKADSTGLRSWAKVPTQTGRPPEWHSALRCFDMQWNLGVLLHCMQA